MSPYLAEFFGTMLLIILGEGVVAGVVLKGTKSENAGWLTICLAWGLAVTISVYAVGSISGAHLNPAITIALAMIGTFPINQVVGYIVAQFAGAFLGCASSVGTHYLFKYLRKKYMKPMCTKLSLF